jgi:hypothetical protein
MMLEAPKSTLAALRKITIRPPALQIAAQA